MLYILRAIKYFFAIFAKIRIKIKKNVYLCTKFFFQKPKNQRSNMNKIFSFLFTLLCAAAIQAQVISTFPYVNSFEYTADLNGWTLVGVARDNFGNYAYHGSYYLRFNNGGSATSPELDLSGLTNPVLSVQTYSTRVNIYVSNDGNIFTLLGAGSAFVLPKTTKHIRINASTQIYVDYLRIVDYPAVSDFSYNNHFDDVTDLDGWTFDDAVWDYRAANSPVRFYGGGSVTSPELNLASLTTPVFFTNAPNATTDVYTSTDGVNFTQLELTGTQRTSIIPKTVKYIRLTNTSESQTLMYQFLVAEIPLISTFPYQLSGHYGWTLDNVATYGNTSPLLMLNEGGSLTSPPLDISGLTTPAVSVRFGYTSAYPANFQISADGVNFNLLGTGGAFILPKTAKYIRITRPESVVANNVTFAQFRIAEAQVVSTFPHENIFEDVSDIDGWTLENAGQRSYSSNSISIHPGGSATSPELNLNALTKPTFSVNTSLQVFVSDNGVDFTDLSSGSSFVIPKTTKYIRLYRSEM